MKVYSAETCGEFSYNLLIATTDALKRALDAGRHATAAEALNEVLTANASNRAAWWYNEVAEAGRGWLLEHAARRALGLRLLDRHSGRGSGLYAVGSTLYAGHTPDMDSLIRAGRELYRGSQEERALYTEMLSTLVAVGLLPRGRTISDAVEGRD